VGICAVILTGGTPSGNHRGLALPERKIENVLDIRISKFEHETIMQIDGQKKSFHRAYSIINADCVEVKEFHTRGNTTLGFRRKSFGFSLKSHARFHHREKTESMKDFNAISLSMDDHYFKNRLAFELMQKIQLLDLFYAYTDLRINGKSEGIYLILERPEDWALKHNDSPLLIRRGYNHHIDKIKMAKHTEKTKARDYRKFYSQIYSSLHKHEGKELYELLSQWMDLDMYMKWLAFNFFVRNGDYTDEVYFYIDPSENRFKVIPWDYDDIFAGAPHEGVAQRKVRIGNKLIFSSEDQLDQKIVNDPYLYQRYLEQLKVVLTQLNEEVLKDAFENTYEELYPYYSTPEIISMAQYDVYKNPDLTSLKKSMDTIHELLSQSRNAWLGQIK